MFLTIDIDDPVLLWVVYGCAVIAFLYLLLRRPFARWLIPSLVALAAGSLLGLLVTWSVDALESFGPPMAPETRVWIVGAFAGIALAAVNLWRSGALRRIVAIISAVLIAATAGLGINAYFGLNPDLGSLFGINIDRPIDLPTKIQTTDADGRPLWETWQDPGGLPATGRVGTVHIPASQSGFDARDAEVYLPPAALAADPPNLPFVLMMMGQPGNPDAHPIGDVLDRFAAEHDGLAPIVLVVDQLGDPSIDPLCLDTIQFGNALTYLRTDAVGWATQNLNISANRTDWTVAGYSNGGQCAISLAARDPEVWGNVIDIAGVEYPGSENADEVLSDVFHGDQAAYDREKPVNILADHDYPDTVAIFTAGSDDDAFGPGVKIVSEAAAAAGMAVTYFEVPNGGHTIVALDGGLNGAFDVLYPRLGLTQGEEQSR
ncbi:alpha/beta hydrolase [Glaciibacter superstes]|uniref:alpha/beta hydrolase n=1 Tax=Glaciibacter superstes TaxID=501023 RepID=UPI000479504D|nr:alpha/beta hydrolase-fold protein [Glaciibacter superstes]